MRHCYIIFQHEIQKLLKDKKMIASIFLMPVLTVLILSFISFATRPKDDGDNSYTIFVLDDAITGEKIEYETGEILEFLPISCTTYEDARQDFNISSDDIVLKIMPDQSIIYYDSTNATAVVLSSFCRQFLMNSYLQSFVNANDINMLDVSITDYASGTGNTILALFLPYMLVLLLFTNISNYTCDTIAGEKERGIFGKTLLTPISAQSVITGKSLSSTVCGLFSTIIYFAVIGLVSLTVSRYTDVDIFNFQSVNLSSFEFLLVGFYAVLLCLMLSNLAVLCSLYAKTAKEARSLLLPFMGASILLSLFSIIRVGNLSVYYYMIPLYNLCIIIQDILSGKVNSVNMIATACSLLLVSAIISFIAIYLFKKESVRY